MWEAVGERVTDLIFRMESFNEDFIRSTWVDATATHDDAQSASRQAMESDTPQQRAAQSSNRQQEEQVVETIRNTAPRVGRNDPCPCGSGKKYKQCHMRK